MDVGGVMAVCLMYLTDGEAAIEQATNASLTRLLRLQTLLATGEFLINHINKIHCSCFEGVLENVNGEQNPFGEETSENDDAIQVSTLISLKTAIFILKLSFNSILIVLNASK
jgi:hypothetical protein